MAAALGIPKRIIEKPPSAGLWQGQTDEEELGISYADIDSFLMRGPLAPKVAEHIRQRVDSSNHKRRMPLIFKDHDTSASPGVSD
jgi:NAD+ synthase